MSDLQEDTEEIKYQIEEVGFKEEDIQVAIDERDGSKWIPIKRICENIGIAHQPQINKLKSDPDFSYNDIIATGNDGKNYTMGCIPADKLEAFLFTISPKKVGQGKNPEIRKMIQKKLALYRSECMDVLHQYWNSGIVVNPAAVPSSGDAALDQLAMIIHGLQTTHDAIKAVNMKNDEQDIKIENQHIEMKSVKERVGNLEEKKILKEADHLHTPYQVIKTEETDSKISRTYLTQLVGFVGKYHEHYDHQRAWNHLYDHLRYEYRDPDTNECISVYNRKPNETKIQALERRKKIGIAYQEAWELFDVDKFRS